jgi:late competence protein required for DNA uptake (superfamily II DNA/RNA helicase)
MILTREIKVKVIESNLHYYENLGYEVSLGEELLIPIELLSKGSHYKIKCKCDICEIEKEVIFKNYVKYGNDWGKYYCRKCSEGKRKKSLQEKYGVDYPIQNKRILSKMKSTLLKKNRNLDNFSFKD